MRSILLVATFLVPVRAFAQEECANVLLVVDRSNSMDRYDDRTTTRWEELRAAVDLIITNYSDGVRYGLAFFPGNSDTEECPGNCEPGDVVVEVGSGTGDAILAAMDASPTCQTTPLAITLEMTRDYLPLRDPDRENYIVVVTDGANNCPLGNADQATADALEWGVRTYVVGFDFNSEVDHTAVDAIASAGGTDHAIIATDGPTLQAAFDDILGGIYRDPEFGCVGPGGDSDSDVDADSDSDSDTDVGGGGDETSDAGGCGCRTMGGAPWIGFAGGIAILALAIRRRR